MSAAVGSTFVVKGRRTATVSSGPIPGMTLMPSSKRSSLVRRLVRGARIRFAHDAVAAVAGRERRVQAHVCRPDAGAKRSMMPLTKRSNPGESRGGYLNPHGRARQSIRSPRHYLMHSPPAHLVVTLPAEHASTIKETTRCAAGLITRSTAVIRNISRISIGWTSGTNTRPSQF